MISVSAARKLTDHIYRFLMHDYSCWKRVICIGVINVCVIGRNLHGVFCYSCVIQSLDSNSVYFPVDVIIL